MRMFMMIAGLSVLFANVAIAEPFDLRGYRLGMTLEEFRAMPYPDPGKYNGLRILCTGDFIPPKTYGAFRLKVGGALAKAGMIRCKHFAPQKLGVLVSTKEATLDVAGVGTFTDFEFTRGEGNSGPLRLFRINIASNMQYWNQFYGAYTQKYGQPGKIDKSVLQNRLGATFPKIVATWTNKQSSMTLEQRDGNIKTMKIVYMHEALAVAIGKRLKKAGAAAAGKL